MLGVEAIKPNVGPTLIQIRTQGVRVGWVCEVVLHALRHKLSLGQGTRT